MDFQTEIANIKRVMQEIHERVTTNEDRLYGMEKNELPKIQEVSKRIEVKVSQLDAEISGLQNNGNSGSNGRTWESASTWENILKIAKYVVGP